MSDTSNKLEVTHVAKGKTTNVVHDRKQSLIQQSNVRTRSYLAIEKNVVMPGILLEDHGIPAVTTFGDFLDELLAHAQTLKPTATVEPPLDKSNFQEILRRVDDSLQSCEAQHTGESAETKRGHRYAIVETAVRDAFTYMVATISVESPGFVRVWNLLDIVLILASVEQCDPNLIFWLVEELLDGQTIDGCRTVFEYLESRRERMIPGRQSQKLVVLRSCNELLRRLSRAEDAAFCGRIFIYMFQSFPLGDRSSVNLRGEFHAENVTIFDVPAAEPPVSEPMDVDDTSGSKALPNPRLSKVGPSDGKPGQISAKPLEPDGLYPIFWGLQTSFSQPKRLFEPDNLAHFKTALGLTVRTFETAGEEQDAQSRSDKGVDKQGEKTKQVLKRKRDKDDDAATGLNPKYLTSRDLFELEISDLSFRRHVLIQALIILDFLLSLSDSFKKRNGSLVAPNKSVLYAEQTLSEEDTKWATHMKKTIGDLLPKHSLDGAHFARMVETVLSRDKNWVRWKSDSCPPITRPAVTPEAFQEAKATAKRMATNKRLRPTPMGSLPLNFLALEGDQAMGKYRSAMRYKLPELTSFKDKIALDELEIDMPTNNQALAAAIESKASKSWRAMRIAGRCKLAAFDKIDSDDKIDVIFQEGPAQDEEEAEDAEEEGGRTEAKAD